jgi:hypothetical protein
MTKGIHSYRFRAGSYLILTAGALLLCGCSAQRYKVDYGGFQNAYATNSNQQMLLNLARLDQHEPTYFLQFGQISVQYNWNTSLNVVGNESIPSIGGTNPLRSPLATGAATLAGTAAMNPAFTFIPVTDEKVAQQLLQPVNPEVLYALFQQGWPVDQLMRLMVDRAEITDQNGTSRVDFNTPGMKGYDLFLNACAVARNLQEQGYMTLEAKNVFTPAVDGVVSDTPPKVEDIISLAKGSGSGNNSDSGGGGGSGGGTKLIWGKLADGKWTVGTDELTPTFKYNGPTDDKGKAQAYANMTKSSEYIPGAVKNMQDILDKGFSVQAKATSNKSGSPGTHLVLRSFLGILAAASQEEAAFNRWKATEPDQFDNVPKIERLPILRLKWDKDEKLLSPVVDLDYRGKYYQITDRDSSSLDEKASWNRDVFRLLIQLSSQVSIDISKYPLPTTLQVQP